MTETLYPLGRKVHHDPRSLAYPVAGVPISSLKSVRWERRAPIFDQAKLGSCFPPGTRVRMADGSERAIEDIKLGEYVVTAENNIGKVVRTILKEENESLIRLVLWGHSHLRMTSNHEVLTRQGYVHASALAAGDEVAMPRYLGVGTTVVATSDLLPNATHRLVRGRRWTGVQGRRGLSPAANQLPEKIELTAATGRLIGLFLAEGSCDASKARWTFGAHEANTLVSETVALLRSEWGVEAHAAHRANNSINVTVHGTAWSRLLHALCGNGAGRKVLSPVLTSGGSEFLEAVLDGWLDGDGHTRPDGAREGVTISRDLAMSMYDIAQGLGLHPVVVNSLPSLNRHAASRQPRWTITLAPGEGRCTQDDTHVWRKVRRIETEPYAGAVYDLTVEGDHSYVAEGVGVHNCVGNTGAGWLGTDNALRQGDPTVNEKLAVALYSEATHLDQDTDEAYPPVDCGSSALGLAKALKARKKVKSYKHAFSLQAALTALQSGPVAFGTTWYESCFDPAKDGKLALGGSIAGGHEILLDEIDVTNKRVWLTNSWSSKWGVSGRAYFTWDDFNVLFHDQGDVVQLTAA